MSDAERRSLLLREGADLRGPMESARSIIREVRRGGDPALKRLAVEFDGFTGDSLTIPESEILSSVGRVDPLLLRALRFSHGRVKAFHSRQRIKPFSMKDPCGLLGQKVIPLERVGVYVPGGTASYASSVIMACAPARVAGVEEIAICTPAKGDRVSDAILAAAALCGVTEVHPVGGAHAVAAMAYGTESIAKVQKIVGPGGAIVSAAKLLVRNDCEIDFLAGPSEVLIIADGKADPELISREMLAQLEHDVHARAMLVTPSSQVAEKARRYLERQIRVADRRKIVAEAAEGGCAIVLVRDLDEAMVFANEYAPEHLLLDVDRPTSLLGKVRNAGSVFLGRYSSVAYGDYCAGTNHILPTNGTAAMKSSLSTYDFLKMIPYQGVTAQGAALLAPQAERLAQSEGLPAHAEAAVARARRGSR